MHLGNHGTAFLPGGCSLPQGPYTVYVSVDVSDDGAATGEVHFLSEPKYPRPIAIGKEFDLHIPHPESLFGDNVILNLRFVDNSGCVAGYVHGSRAQFRPRNPGQSVSIEDAPMSSTDVFVIHGRDERLRSGIFEFLRVLGLNPMEWARAVELTGKGSPYVGEVLDAAFSNAQAVVVLFSPDDVAMLRPELQGPTEPEHETNLTPQARPNVLFEAGMAMARHPDRTILVEIGNLRPFSDIGGRHMLRMDNSPKKRNELATRLKTAGCPVSLAGTDWQTTGDLRAPEVKTAPRTVRDNPQGLSAEAEQLLVAGSKDPGGTVMCVPTIQGLTVSTNNRGFAESGNPRSQATWKAAVGELVRAGLLEPLSDEAFGITHEGYERAEGVRLDAPGASSGQPPNTERPKRTKAQQHDYELARRAIAESGPKANSVLKHLRTHGPLTFGIYGPAILPGGLSESDTRSTLNNLAERGLVSRRDSSEPRDPRTVYDIAAPMKEILEELLFEDA
jgi:predicted nucleotide-binding protein